MFFIPLLIRRTFTLAGGRIVCRASGAAYAVGRTLAGRTAQSGIIPRPAAGIAAYAVGAYFAFGAAYSVGIAFSRIAAKAVIYMLSFSVAALSVYIQAPFTAFPASYQRY